jgi:anti-sigma28 factor (negative regulator of flagellin synthesis)
VKGKRRMSGSNPKRPAPPPPGQAKVPRLKEQITTRTYRVDSQAVAREMLFKMRMLKLVRDRAQRRS